MGLYSKKHKKLSDLKPNAVIGIPVDPSNNSRALLLLQAAGLLQLSLSNSLYPTLDDITQNNQHFIIKAVDAALLPRLSEDFDLAAINTNFAIPSGLQPFADALFLETKDSPYANLLVVRQNDALNPKYQLLLQALHSEEVLKAAKHLFSDYAVPAW